jgi:hypothetical protein
MVRLRAAAAAAAALRGSSWRAPVVHSHSTVQLYQWTSAYRRSGTVLDSRLVYMYWLFFFDPMEMY